MVNIDCFNCRISEICIIKDNLFKAAPYGNINFTDCKIKPGYVIGTEATTLLKPVMGISNVPDANSIPQPPVRHVRDFRVESNQLRHKDNVLQSKPDGIKVINDNSDEVKTVIPCPKCGEETFLEDLKSCCKCHDSICNGCGTHSNSGLLCEKCWDAE